MTRRGAAVCGLVLVAVVGLGCSAEAIKQRHFNEGNRLLADGATDAAIVEFRNALAQDDLWGEARFRLAEAYAAGGNAEAAFREYLRAADQLPDDPVAQLKAAAYLLMAGQYTDAHTRVRPVLEKNPRNAEAQIVAGNALAGLRDLDGAVTQLNEAIGLDPSRGQSYANLGLVRSAQGDIAEARSAFNRAVAIDSKSVPAWLALANFQWSTNDAVGAKASLERAYGIDPKHPITNRALATFQIISGTPNAAEPYLRFVAESTDTTAAKLALADYYVISNRSADARAVLQPMTAVAGTRTLAESRLAAVAYSTGERRQGHSILDQILLRDPNDAESLLLKARWLLSEGMHEQALVRAQAATAANPRLVTAHYVRGLAESASGRSKAAIESFSQVLRLNARAVSAQVHLSRLHLARNAIDTAVLFAEEGLRNAPDSLDARLALARAWVARNDAARARADLAVLRVQAPDSAEVHALDGAVNVLLGNLVGASNAFERALQIDPGQIEALVGLTRLDMLHGNGTVARERVEARLKRSVDHPEVLLLAAKVHAVQQSYARATTLLRRAIDQHPLGIDTYLLMGQLLALTGGLDEATTQYDAIASREPSNLGAQLMQALLAHTRGELDEAKERYREVLNLEPRAALAANNLAAIYAEEVDGLLEAQRLAESAVDLMPSQAEFQDTMGWVYYRRRLIGESIRHFDLALQLDADNPTYHYHMGLAQSKAGDFELARSSLKKALTLKPDMSEAQTLLATLQNN